MEQGRSKIIIEIRDKIKRKCKYLVFFLERLKWAFDISVLIVLIVCIILAMILPIMLIKGNSTRKPFSKSNELFLWLGWFSILQISHRHYVGIQRVLVYSMFQVLQAVPVINWINLEMQPGSVLIYSTLLIRVTIIFKNIQQVTRSQRRWQDKLIQQEVLHQFISIIRHACGSILLEEFM